MTTNKKAIIKQPSEKKLMWLGAQRLMTKASPGSKEEQEQKTIVLASRVLGVSPFGVNILGGMPYINKLGLVQKAKEYEPGIKFVYEWVKVAEDDIQKAIVKAKVIDAKGQELTDWIIGECSPSSMKMSTLKGYQNHMAQTRARNRAILEAFGDRIHVEMMKRIEILSQTKGEEKIDTKLLVQAGGAVNASAEEIQTDKSEYKKQSTALDNREALYETARDAGAKQGQEKQFIEQKLDKKIDWSKLTAKHYSMLKTELMSKETK